MEAFVGLLIVLFFVAFFVAPVICGLLLMLTGLPSIVREYEQATAKQATERTDDFMPPDVQ